MTVETNILSIPLPADHNVFETWCLWLAQSIYGFLNADFYGRGGQTQSGIDIIATTGSDSRIGIQCKKLLNVSDAKVQKEFNEDFRAALSISPHLTDFIFCTTHPTSAKLQDFASKLQQEQYNNDRNINVLYWGFDTIQNKIRSYPELLQRILYQESPVLKDRVIVADSKNGKTIYSEEKISSVINSQTTPQTIQHSLTIGEIADDAHEPIIRTYIDQLNSGKPNIALTGLHNIDHTNLTNKARAKIFATIGRIYHRLDNASDAIIFTQKAIQLDETSPIGRFRKSFLYYLQENYEVSIEISKELMDDDIDNRIRQEAAHQYLLSLSESISLEVDPLAFIPEDLIGTVPVCTAHVYCLDKQGIDSSDIANEYKLLHPQNIFLRTRASQSPLIKITNRLGVTDFRYEAREEEVEPLRECCRNLDEIWQEIKGNEPEAIILDVPLNLIIAYIWLNDFEKALALSREVITLFTDLKDAQQLHIELLQRHSTVDELENYLNSLENKSGFWDFYLVEKHFREGNIFQAQKIADDIDLSILRADNKHVGIFTLMAELELAKEQTNIALARQYLREERALNPTYINSYLIEVKLIEDTSGDENQINRILEEVTGVIRDDTPIAQRVILASFFRERKKLKEAISLLEGRVSLTIPTYSLRLYLELLVESGNRSETFQRIYRDIPTDVHEELKTKPLYTQFLISVGNYAEAETYAKELASIVPPDLRNKLTYAQVLWKNENYRELNQYLESIGDIPLDTPAVDLMKFGIINFLFGNAERGLQQVYASGLLNQNDVNIARNYVMFILQNGQVIQERITPKVDAVEVGHAVHIKSGDKEKVWVLEDIQQLRPSSSVNYVSSTTPIGHSLMGKKLGDSIEIYSEEWSIINIQYKEIYLHQLILETLWSKHESVEGIELLTIDTSLPREQQFEPIFSKLRERNERIHYLWEQYQQYPLPFRTFCHVIGSEVWDVYDGLGGLEGNLKACVGDNKERQSSFSAIDENNGKGFVADLLTCRILYQHNLFDVMCSVLGRPFISNHSIDKVQLDIQIHGDSDQPSGTMVFRDGKYYFIEYSQKELEQQKNEKLNFRNYLRRFEQVPPIGRQDISSTLKLSRDSHFFDDAQVASGRNIILLSEDWGYRYITDHEISNEQQKLRSSWIQPVLIKAVQRRLITEEEYYEYVFKLIINKHDFMTVPWEYLRWGVLNDDIEDKDIFKAVIRPNTDWNSLYSVTVDFYNSLWKENISTIHKQNITREYLNYFFKNRNIFEAYSLCFLLSKKLTVNESRRFVEKYLLS